MSIAEDIEGTPTYCDSAKVLRHRAVQGTHYDRADAYTGLERTRSARGLIITPETFEKIYLSPKDGSSNSLRSRFGNPTPMALLGFVIALTPLSNVLLGWRGAGGLGAAEVGVYYFFGGLLMILGAIFELILGNTFPSVVFAAFSAFWLSFAATLTPFYNASIAYLPEDPTNAGSDPTFLASFGYFHVYMGLLCVVFMIVALRTNIVFVLIFALLIPAFGCFAGYFWQNARGVPAAGLLKVAGGLCFACSLLGWYLLVVQLFVAVDFPLELPVGDLSGLFNGRSERAKEK